MRLHLVGMRLLAIVALGLVLSVVLAPAAPAQQADACPFGWSPEETVWFAPPRIDTGILNPERDDGCTLLDVIWRAEPFAHHGTFVATVSRTTQEFVRDGLLRSRERALIVLAAARSDVGGPDDASIPNTCDQRVALTFDDGPSAYRPQTLAILRDRQVPATFFDSGMRVDANPQIVAFEAAEGHTVLNHTYSHPNLNQLFTSDGAAAVERELLDTEAAFADAGVTPPFKGMRPPFLAANANVRGVLDALGFAAIGATVGAGQDWLPTQTAEQTRDAVLGGLRPGGIVIMHDGPIDTAAGAAVVAALPEIIDGARAQGHCWGRVDRHGQVVATRLVPRDDPIPSVVNPVPYLPLLFGGGDPPEPFVVLQPPITPPVRRADLAPYGSD